jgi:uncharacterized membrane protein YeaQ/YmgE (transglycosylase-associated protein family)
MGILLAILIGAFIGWLASLIMGTDGQQGAIANILIGIVGASIGRWVFADLLRIGSATSSGAVTLTGLVWAVLGACLLIGVLKLVRVMA